MEEIKDLEVLSKYLSDEELKDIAKKVAYAKFERMLGSKNTNAESNFDWYMKQGAFLAVQDYITDFDKEKLASEMTSKTSKIIQKLDIYHLPNTYSKIAIDYIEENKKMVTDKVDLLLTEFVNSNSYSTAYQTFNEYIGDRFSDMLYTMLEKEFKTKQ